MSTQRQVLDYPDAKGGGCLKSEDSTRFCPLEQGPQLAMEANEGFARFRRNRRLFIGGVGKGAYVWTLGNTMHVTLPDADGQDSGCPHQFVGSCDMCSSRNGIRTRSEADLVVGQNDVDRHEFD